MRFGAAQCGAVRCERTLSWLLRQDTTRHPENLWIDFNEISDNDRFKPDREREKKLVAFCGLKLGFADKLAKYVRHLKVRSHRMRCVALSCRALPHCNPATHRSATRGSRCQRTLTFKYKLLFTLTDGRRNDNAGRLAVTDSRTGVHAETILTVHSQVLEQMTQCWRRKIQWHIVRLYIKTKPHKFFSTMFCTSK